MTNRPVDGNQAPWGDGHSQPAWRMNRRRFLTVAALSNGPLAGTPVWAQEGATKIRLSLGTSATSAVPVDYLGFSCETAQLADPTFFAAHNATLWRLQAPELTATSGVTLAGAEFKPGKTWCPTQEIKLAGKNRKVQIEMEPGSGAALFFKNGISSESQTQNIQIT